MERGGFRRVQKVILNTNYLALVSQNNLSKSQGALGTAIERLSSGLRINSAKDDAAGQAIANRFTANVKGLTQAARNANDGISIAQTTEGSLNEINNNLQRIRELSVQAANGSNSQTDLDSIQAEIRERLDEIDRVSRETQFNGKYVLGDDAARLSIQVGAHDNQRIDIELSRIDSTTLGLGSFNVNSLSAGDLSGALTTVTTQTSTDVNIGANTASPGPYGPVMEAEGVYKATLTTTGVITPAVNFDFGTTIADANAVPTSATIASIVSYEEGGDIKYAATVAGGTADANAVTLTVNADGTFDVGGIVDLTAGGITNITEISNGDEYQAAVTGDVEVDGYAVKGEDGNYYALTYNEATDKWVWDSSTDALDVAKVNVADGPIENLPVYEAFDKTDAAWATGAGAAGTAVTETGIAAGGLEIDYSAGLFERNDVINEPGSATAKFAVLGNDGNYYEITADLSGATPAFTIDLDPANLVQVSAANIGGEVTQLAVDEEIIDPADDLLNQDLAGLTSDGLFALADGSGYVVRGSDGNFYGATLDEDTGNVTWNSNTEVDAADVDVNGGAIEAIVGDALEGNYTGLAAGETLHSYTDANGATQYVVKSGTGGDAVYTRATLGAADPVTGDVAVTKATGDDATLSVRSTDPLAALDAALQQVDDLRSHLGAIQNRFESTIANLNNTINNLSAARSRIEDADYAVEVSNMTRAQILQQAGTSVLAQANQVPQTVLSLLR